MLQTTYPNRLSGKYLRHHKANGRLFYAHSTLGRTENSRWHLR